MGKMLDKKIAREKKTEIYDRLMEPDIDAEIKNVALQMVSLSKQSERVQYVEDFKKRREEEKIAEEKRKKEAEQRKIEEENARKEQKMMRKDELLARKNKDERMKKRELMKGGGSLNTLGRHLCRKEKNKEGKNGK